jgi:hypothetical protein
MIEEDGKDPLCNVFDTLIIEILFNDQDPVLSVDPVQRPVAGELAANSATTVDAFSRERIKAIKLYEMPIAIHEKEIAASERTQLTLKLPSGDATGRYRHSTGRAGLRDFGTPFRLSVDRGSVSVAMGKLEAGFQAVKVGTSNIVPVGVALLGSTPLCLNSVVGSITVVE